MSIWRSIQGLSQTFCIMHSRLRMIGHSSFIKQLNIQGGAGGCGPGLSWLWYRCSTILPSYPANSAIFPSAQAELGRQWNDLNQCQPNPRNKCQPNPSPRPPAPPCMSYWYWNVTNRWGICSESRHFPRSRGRRSSRQSGAEVARLQFDFFFFKYIW